MAYRSPYQYETTPRKLAPEYEKKEKKRSKKSTVAKKKASNKQQEQTTKNIKEKKRQKIRTVIYVLSIFSMLFVISYRNSTIAEDFSKIKTLKSDLAMIEKENEQLKVNIESSLNLKTVEETAKTTLGMQKMNNDQTIYISLPMEDYIESASEQVIQKESEPWFMKLVNGLLEKIK